MDFGSTMVMGRGFLVRVQMPDRVGCPEASPGNKHAKVCPAILGCLILEPRVHIRGVAPSPWQS